MTIIIKNISDAKGGKGGTLRDDFRDIIGNPKYGGFANIKKIDVKGMTGIKSDVTIYSIQFVYNVMTKDGTSYEHQGIKRGEGLGGLDQMPFDFAGNGGLTEIRGRFGAPGGVMSIRYLMFKTPQKTLECGKSNPTEQEFVLPPGVIFGNSGLAVDSIGVYEIAEEEQLVKTATSTIIETITGSTSTVTSVTTDPSVTTIETIFVDNPRIIIGLSIPLTALSVLVLMSLYYKYRNRDSILRVAGSSQQ